MSVRPQVQLQLPLSSPIQIEPPAYCTPAPFSVFQPPVRADQNEPMKPSPTVKESERPLQKETNRPLMKLVTPTSIFDMHITFRNVISSMPSLRFVLGCLEAVSRKQTNVDELLRFIRIFGHRAQKKLDKQPPVGC